MKSISQKTFCKQKNIFSSENSVWFCRKFLEEKIKININWLVNSWKKKQTSIN